MPNVLTYLEQSAEKFPQKTAFWDETDAVSFAQLRARGQSIGSALIPHSGRRAPVVFFGEKSAWMACGFMGAVYAGCFYAVLDPKHPPQRACAILQKLGVNYIIAQDKYREKAEQIEFSGTILSLETLAETPVDEALLAARRRQAISTDPLYAMFTSGSTGQPKIVLVSHRSVTDFIDVFTQTFAMTERDSFANQAPFDFDVSVKDIYAGLKLGATVHIIPRSYFSFPTKLMDFLCEREPTTLIWAVSALVFVTTMKAFDYKKPESIRAILFSGEVLPIKHLHQLRAALPKAQLVNLYGPTEITCNCTYHIIDRDYTELEAIPIGTAFPNETVFLLDAEDTLVTQAGVQGEICVAGTALALGYYDDAAKTNEVFVQNPLNHSFAELIYRTGDLGRYDENGLLYYVSRKDFQIKYMGHRIELGEIETALHAIAGVTRACCVYHEEKQRITAYYTGDVTKKEIVACLKETLPLYMMPGSFVMLEEMPITQNGKIDRACLKEMQTAKRAE